jgi:hypothetical protein
VRDPAARLIHLHARRERDPITPAGADSKEKTMSVIMTLRVPGDPEKLEQLARANPDTLRAIAERAKAAGVIAHRFYGADGQIAVIDEWPDAESFQRFYASEQETIEPMMREVATGEPEITFWHKLETGDEIGWGR